MVPLRQGRLAYCSPSVKLHSLHIHLDGSLITWPTELVIFLRQVDLVLGIFNHWLFRFDAVILGESMHKRAFVIFPMVRNPIIRKVVAFNFALKALVFQLSSFKSGLMLSSFVLYLFLLLYTGFLGLIITIEKGDLQRAWVEWITRSCFAIRSLKLCCSGLSSGVLVDISYLIFIV